MYEELIMRLMEDKSWIEQGTTETEHEIADHLRKAADAIEELTDKNVGKWISVTEGLPEEAYACLAIVWDNNPYSGDTFLNYYPEFVGYGEGSWNDYDGDEIPFDVVYWMKLPQIPEPTKEET